MKKLKLKNISKRKNLLIVLIIFVVVVLITTIQISNKIQMNRQELIKSLEGKQLVEFVTTSQTENENFYSVLVTVNAEEGLEKIKYTDIIANKDVEINCSNKFSVSFDLIVEDRTNFSLDIKKKGQSETTETKYYEAPRVQGNYTLKNGIYAYEPDISSFNPNYTRYIEYTDNGNLKPGNWINGQAPQKWYDYANSVWANIYTENNGAEGYYVWIPRYAYKLDQQTQRSDIKFIDVYNNYKAEDGTVTNWSELEKQGYTIPEAFTWYDNTYDKAPVKIPGYWMSKYQLSNLEKYTLDFLSVATKTSITVKDIKTNTDKTIAKYQYFLNGELKHTSTTPEDYTITDIGEGSKYINVTALDGNDEIVGSMTQSFEPVTTNPPDLQGFNKDTTFYVYWDEDGTEHSEIPISQDPPSDWYDYSISNWANIVVRSNGTKSYFTWIPRYAYMLDQTAQKSYIQFLEGTSSDVKQGYTIPEAFWWDNNGNGIEDEGEALTGYWMSKYQLSDEAPSEQVVTAEEIAANPKKYYGARVTNYTQGANYRIFYVDTENKYGDGANTVYLIADYDENRKMSLQKPSGVLYSYDSTKTKIRQMNPTWSSYIGSLQESSWSKNARGAAYLCDTSKWTLYYDSTQANYVIGGPSIEMYADSYNQTHNQNSLIYTCTPAIGGTYKTNDGKGYFIGANGSYSNNGWWTSNNTIDTAQNEIYMKTNTYTWLASPSANNTNYVSNTNGVYAYVLYSGMHGIIGFRPIVSLKSDATIKIEV